MKFRWLLLSFLGIFLFCSPANAGKLLSWQYEERENRLIFLTDQGVQPQAQLLSDPARLVIDLPGTRLGRETVKENYSGTIRSLRVGQFDEQTARIVLELAPGYTIDPQQVRFRGVSSTQWMVDIPRPIVAPSPRVNRIRENRATMISSPPPTPIDSQTASEEEDTVVSDSPHVRTTRNGFFISIDGNKNNKIKTSRDGNTINFELEGITLPSDLAAKAIAVNQYGVSTIEFTQTSSSPARAKVSLKVTEDNSNWLATFSSFRGLVLVPRGGVQSSFIPTRTTSNALTSRNRRTIVSGIELANNDTELLINANQAISGEIKENNNGFYEIVIPNAILAANFNGPELSGNSPIAELRVRQEGSSVLVLVTTRLGVRMGQSDGQGTNVLSLPLGRGLASLPARNEPSYTPRAADSVVIDIPQPANRTAPNLFPSRPLPSPSSLGSSASSNRTLVFLDAGHGGQDPGTIGIGGLREKDIVLPITMDVAEILRKQGIEVKLTRDSDYFVSLQGRTDMANQVNADLFVSIHANAINLSRPDVNGLETYYYQTGRRLAEVIHWNMLNSVNIRDRGIRRARFYVLRHSEMPSVLVEVGFVTGAEDAPRLKNPTHRRQLAEAIARGIIQYIKENRL